MTFFFSSPTFHILNFGSPINYKTVLIAAKQMNRRRWICGDVWMDILPSFDRPQLGLKMALISDRFDCLVDTHFDVKTTEFTIWRPITIRKGIGPKPEMFVRTGDNVTFSLPDHPLPNKIRFKSLQIDYIDHSVIEFLRFNQQIWDRIGTNLEFSVNYSSDETESDVQPIWDVLAREILPIFAQNIRQLYFYDDHHLDNLRRHISPTILTELDQLHSIECGWLCHDGIADDGPNATAGQVLSKWLHTPTKNGQPKRLRYCNSPHGEGWVTNFKKIFLRATDSSVSYKINFGNCEPSEIHLKPFELVNEQTKEKLTLEKMPRYGGVEFIIYWLMKRCPISEEASTDQWEDDEFWDDNNLNNVHFFLRPCRQNQREKKKEKTKKRVKASKYRRTARK